MIFSTIILATAGYVCWSSWRQNRKGEALAALAAGLAQFVITIILELK
jgi:hypothetical protein